MTGRTNESNALIRSAPQQLEIRRAWLVERGIHSFPVLGISDCRVEELCSALWDDNFDNRARALKKIAELGTHIRTCRRYLDSLIFPVVMNIYYYFGPEATVGYCYQCELFSHGRHYPPSVEYLELLCTALESLVGPVQSPGEAIMDVILYGMTESRIRGILWLANQTLTSSTHHAFSDYIEISLISNTQKTPLLLALKYADAVKNNHVDKTIYFFISEIIFQDTPDKLKAISREYLVSLHEKATQKTLFYAFKELAESGEPLDIDCASELFDDVMHRDLDKYSDDDLKMILCFIRCQSNEQDNVEEYEECVMEELRRRALYG